MMFQSVPSLLARTDTSEQSSDTTNTPVLRLATYHYHDKHYTSHYGKFYVQYPMSCTCLLHVAHC